MFKWVLGYVDKLTDKKDFKIEDIIEDDVGYSEY